MRLDGPKAINMKLYIKNMACNCCTELIKMLLDKSSIKYLHVDLGEVETADDLSPEELVLLNAELKKSGLELLDNKRTILIEKIKNAIDEYVLDSSKRAKTTFSKYLSKRLNYDYNYLSALFSEVQANTIEQYIIVKRVEQAKQMIMFEDLTISEIADKLHYSSPAHLSGQFKKVTGLSPSHFKKLRQMRDGFRMK
jgi:AraC-like DNA-binding protein